MAVCRTFLRAISWIELTTTICTAAIRHIKWAAVRLEAQRRIEFASPIRTLVRG